MARGRNNSRKGENDTELWKQYRETRSQAARETLIRRYQGFVQHVAGRLAVKLPSCVDFDDLVSYGTFGLLDAMEKYEPSRNNKFETYAKNRIRGSILDQLREEDRVPRSVRQKNRRLEEARNLLEERLGRPPADTELAELLNVEAKVVRSMCRDYAQSVVVSLDERAPDAEVGVTRRDFVQDRKMGSPEEQAERDSAKIILADAIGKLTERERLVISLHYFEQLTFKEIAMILRVSDSRVSQIHTAALRKLKGKLEKVVLDLAA